jgi:hypothetical protein
MTLLFTAVFTMVLAYALARGVIDFFTAPPEKKKKCEKCKKEEPMEGSNLCYYCEIVVFRQEQKKKRDAQV